MKNKENRSPFLIKQEFISPKMCEFLVDSLEFVVPDEDKEGRPIKMVKHDDASQQLLFDRLQNIVPEIEEYYGIKYRGTEEMCFEWYPEECVGGRCSCENSNYLRKKWVKTKDRDISGILFLSDYQPTIPFDNEYEVYGGRLQFPQHGFKFQPERGTLILFPSGPHFINAIDNVYAGDLFQVRFHIAAKTPMIYQPADYPGDYTTWFEDIA